MRRLFLVGATFIAAAELASGCGLVAGQPIDGPGAGAEPGSDAANGGGATGEGGVVTP